MRMVSTVVIDTATIDQKFAFTACQHPGCGAERARDLVNSFNVGGHPSSPYRIASERLCVSPGATFQSSRR